MSYEIIEATSARKLADLVNVQIKLGATLVGGPLTAPYSHAVYYFQAVLLP